MSADAKIKFKNLKSESGGDDDVLCSQIYNLFYSRAASKAVAAQYLAGLLPIYCKEIGIDTIKFRKILPTYIVEAIDYLTREGNGALDVLSLDGKADYA